MNGIAKLFKLEGSEICKLANSLDMNNFQSLINRVSNCKKNIFITGCGTSAMAAKKAVHTLNVISKPVFYLNPSDAVHGGLGAIYKVMIW
jgi:Predicted sugar phosphate isomerase involved in capsule formation